MLNILKYQLNEERHVLAWELYDRMEAFINENTEIVPSTWTQAEVEGVEAVKKAFAEPGLKEKLDFLKARGPGFKRLFEREGYSVGALINQWMDSWMYLNIFFSEGHDMHLPSRTPLKDYR
jgi:hypothetical protein